MNASVTTHAQRRASRTGRNPKHAIAQQLEAVAGRHDEARFYTAEPGDPGLCGGPGSMSWELHADMASLVVAGNAAILMEVLHPSVMHGVYTQSSYREQPTRRARNTLGYVLRTTFGNTTAATKLIDHVKRMHSRVSGTRPDGVRYQALDPELIAWVHTCIPWAVMTACERTRRSLSIEEKDRYLKEQAMIGRMGGADRVPESVAELEHFAEAMRPRLAMNQQTVDFIGFLEGRVDAGHVTPSPLERLDRRTAVTASMTLMPEWARRMTGTHHSEALDRLALSPFNHLRAQLIRWAYPEPPCVELAKARVAADCETAARRAAA